MALEFISVIRELTDTGSTIRKKRTLHCSDLDNMALSEWEPNTDIVEFEEHVEILLELAGVSKKGVNICLRNGNLIISGTRPAPKHVGRIDYHHMEINYGHFVKVITIPESIEHNDIVATLNDGLLKIQISKKSQVIEIPISVRMANEK